jgi:hypothetical protein
MSKKIELPAPGKTPLEELKALQSCIQLFGNHVHVDFEGSSEGSSISVTLNSAPNEADADLAERLLRLAPFLIQCEIPDWDQEKGATGNLRIWDSGIWMDAVDHNEDWLLERNVDLDLLEEMIFEENQPDFDL